jgi:hypothetical protein
MGCKVRPLQVRYINVTRVCRLPPAGRECLLVWEMAAGTQHSLNKNSANRPASFLSLGPFSSMSDGRSAKADRVVS